MTNSALLVKRVGRENFFVEGSDCRIRVDDTRLLAVPNFSISWIRAIISFSISIPLPLLT